MKEPTKKKEKSGYAKMKAAGRTAIVLTVTPEQKELLKRAAKREHRSVAGFIVAHSLFAAEERLSGLFPPDLVALEADPQT